MAKARSKPPVTTVRSKSPIASDVVKDAIKNCSKRIGKKVNYKDLATTMDVNPSSIWFPIMSDRAWVVDRWLMALQALGCLEIEEDRITIFSDRFEKYKKSFNAIDIL